MKLLESLSMGDKVLSNRIIMAPLTRCRADEPGSVPNALMATYYAQRACAGLIVTEATQVSAQGQGYYGAPGLYTDAQEAAWKKLVEAVHAKGSLMAVQLWHVGRMSHSFFQKNAEPPVAPSALLAEDGRCRILQADGTAAFVPCEKPRALETGELPGIVEQFRQAAIRAKRAGFDFVEIHAANGYLLHQFLATNTNRRTDIYGGPMQNRARLVLKVVDAVMAVMGAGGVGVRLSPHFNINGIEDGEAEPMTLYLVREFSSRRIAYVHIAEPSWTGGIALTDDFKWMIREAMEHGCLILCGEYTPEKAEKAVESTLCDAVGFGRLFIANPDLVERIAQGSPCQVPDRDTFYSGGATGYVDYPALTS